MSHEVAVRTLCEFTAKRGDLDIRFTPSPSALEGIAAHRTIASRRGSSFQSEVMLSGEYAGLRVRGRADGYDPEAQRVEEFKSYRGDLERMPANHRALHWAQLRIYGWLLCCRERLSTVRLALVYFDVATERETVMEETQTADELERHFQSRCHEFLSWAQAQSAHRSERDAQLLMLQFPFPQLHEGQRELAKSVYRRIRAGGALLAQAPTGIGKTLGTLFPALKAMAADSLDKVFYLVAKTSGRRMALVALKTLADSAPGLRVVELVARDKSCEYPGTACDAAVCPLSRGFYDRLPAAREDAMRTPFLDQAAIRAVASKHRVCPYYLGQELAHWSDVVVGDYNYYFDRSAMLYGWTVLHEWRVCLLVDEAHNLVERGRAMYTVSLDQDGFESVRRTAPTSLGRVFEAVLQAWRDVLRGDPEPFRIHDELPRDLISACERFVTAVIDHLSSAPADARQLQEVFFDVLAFCRLAADFDSNSMLEITRSASGSQLCLRNLVPGRFLAPRFAAARASVLFSATLKPQPFFRDVLGLPAGSECLEVDSPFRPEQLSVRLVRISTRFRDRRRSWTPLADLLARQFASRPGNYLAFLSSFEYLEQVAGCLSRRYPHIPCWKQLPGMKEPDRDAFLARFQPEGQGVGFAVLGGAFAEGIDLPGSRLIGAFIATLGLPQVNPVNEEMQRRMQSLFGAGYEYTYLYPGLQKVVQAAGRIIRTTSDEGVLYLIDDRYGEARIRELLPRWWGIGAAAARTRVEYTGEAAPQPARSKGWSDLSPHPSSTVSPSP